MSVHLACPYLGAEVELTEERQAHIAGSHPELVPALLDCLRAAVESPDAVRRSQRSERALLFSRWYDDLGRGKYVVVVVMRDSEPATRNWVVTAYLTNRLAGGPYAWQKS